ncbi:unnamed protein product [Schistosoma mattheei]|uniref:Uncharacterized protein n=1 Tax=Schistosoma mattheei TaxID=31246 RepID=A0AA85B8K5_9TREM|nr:unnamed protein product [Schistosoma mattheei]
MALDNNVPLLLTQSFLDLRDECYSLMDKRFTNNNRIPKNTTIYAYAKLFAQFCLLSEELERWLKRVCKMAFEGRLAYGSRSESYMNQMLNWTFKKLRLSFAQSVEELLTYRPY